MRLFFALQPEPAAAAELVAQIAPLVAELRGQAVPASNVHATLCFLGQVPEQRFEALRAVADGVTGHVEPLSFDLLEVWRKPRVLCATAPEASAPGVSALAERLCAAARAAGFVPDLKPFRPHLTLGRKIDLERAEQSAWPRSLEPGLVVSAEKFVLMESRRGEHGSIYSVVDSWPLDAPTPR
jgi:RNA 2',3'-cyclic 3'-phosphodiesterase